MSRVDSIGTSTCDNHPLAPFGTISRCVAGGVVTGYAAKYLLPLTDLEKGPNYDRYVFGMREDANRTKGFVIDEIRAKEHKTPAQDLFIKMVDHNTEGVKPFSLLDIVSQNGKFSEEDKAEYKNLFNSLSEPKADKDAIVKSIRELDKKSPAQELFLKVVDAEALTKKHASEMRKFLRESNLNEEGKKEFLNIIEQVNNKARQSFKEFVSMYNSGLKRVKRPALTFMSTGAALGLIVGVISKAFTYNAEA